MRYSEQRRNPLSDQPKSASSLAKAAMFDKAKEIFACLSVGASLKDAAAFARITVEEIHAEKRRDPEFARGLSEARRRGKVHHLDKIGKAPAWQASAWVLERRWRNEFGRNIAGGPRTSRSRYDWARLSDQEVAQLSTILQKALIERGKSSAGKSDRSLPGPAAPEG